MNKEKDKSEKFSYSRLEKYENCPFAYKLTYIDKHYVNASSLALSVGTLLHKVNEYICSSIIFNKAVDYDKINEYIELAGTTDIKLDVEGAKEDKEEIQGTKILQREFFEDWLNNDTKSKLSMKVKVENFKKNIHKLEDSFKGSEWQPFKTEEPFDFEYNGVVFHGFIDRIDKNIKTGELRVIDYKTKDAPFSDKDLTTPLQFVIYAMAIKEKFGEYPVEFIYDLPLIDVQQKAGTKGFIERGKKKLDKILANINEDKERGEFKPKPSPLCYFCQYCTKSCSANTGPEKQLCKYYSLWTPQNHTFEVNAKWGGLFILE